MRPFSFLKTLSSNSVQVFRRTPPLVFAMSVLSLGGLIGFTSASKILVSGLRPIEDTITVTGASTERIESDMAKWDINVQTKGSSQIDSYKKHTKSMKKTIDFLDRYGVKTNDYQTRELGPATTSKKVTKNTKTGEIISTHWLTSQWIEIESTDVANINKTHRKISDLLGQGIEVKPNSPKFTYTKLTSLTLLLALSSLGLLCPSNKGNHHHFPSPKQVQGQKLLKEQILLEEFFSLYVRHYDDLKEFLGK